ncbi:LIM domain only protein 3 isoform X2 [Pseudoliparis swirei]|uniref:LIM domain only protein 3 isoform X2 n=1 Tax=Pseudoliparis swirei TaxID=2059687 RepID=UPI0024BE37BE|nr:LIM domain only protein 3 isoform X2 [Pseudoliparis swirei]
MLSVQPDTKPKGCAGCNRKIKDRYLLKALDKYWHEDCLKCACCDCRLGEVGSTLYTKANLILCQRDYLRLFGVTGNCAACNKLIPAFEMVMRAKENVYHLDCFACQLCNQRFITLTGGREDTTWASGTPAGPGAVITILHYCCALYVWSDKCTYMSIHMLHISLH